MNYDLSKLSEKLSVNDIDWRVGTGPHTKGDMAWVSLLGYKTARVDARRLDQVVGPNNWKCEYEYRKKSVSKRSVLDGNEEVNHEEGTVLWCKISIWDDEKGEWVGKEDVGSESFSDADKGEASDAFKRAGFKWGIGAELYDLPFIYCKLKDHEWYKDNYGNVRVNSKFRPNDWFWHIDWDKESSNGARGLIIAKEAKADSSYRVKTNIFMGDNHKR